MRASSSENVNNRTEILMNRFIILNTRFTEEFCKPPAQRVSTKKPFLYERPHFGTWSSIAMSSSLRQLGAGRNGEGLPGAATRVATRRQAGACFATDHFQNAHCQRSALVNLLGLEFPCHALYRSHPEVRRLASRRAMTPGPRPSCT
jgi:hypothetical protein